MPTRFLGQFFNENLALFLVYLTNNGNIVFMGDDTAWDPIDMDNCTTDPDSAERFHVSHSEYQLLVAFKGLAEDIKLHDLA